MPMKWKNYSIVIDERKVYTICAVSLAQVRYKLSKSPALAKLLKSVEHSIVQEED